MWLLLIILVMSAGSFIAGIYYEKSNSIRKVKPIKKVVTNLNKGRTIVVDRTKK